MAGTMVTFQQPVWLLAAGLAIVPAALAALARRKGHGARRSSVILQTLAVLIAAFALAQPVGPWGESSRRPYLVLTDVSDSLRGQTPLALPKELPREELVFAGDVAESGRDVDTTSTRLSPALRLALARAGEISGVVVRSDGRFQDRDWPTLAAAIASAGKKIYVVAMESPPVDARISQLTSERQADGSVRLRVTVEANAPLRRRLKVWREGQESTPLYRQDLDLLSQAATVMVRDAPPADGATVYRAAIEEPDSFMENNVATAAVLPSGSRLAGAGGPDALLQAVAAETGLAMDRVPPAGAARWDDYAAVVLADGSGEVLTPVARASLAEYVRGGGGLVLIGAGPHAAPADRIDPLNQVAALVANPFQRRPMQLVVVLDASGSMSQPAAEGGEQSGRVKFDLAREAVLSLRRHLTEADVLTVITFSNSPRRVYDSGGGPTDFGRLANALAQVRPSGPTVIGPALDLATATAPATGRTGMVLVVSDLRTQPFDAAAMAERFRRQTYSLAVAATPTAGESPAGQSPLQTLAKALDAPLVRGVELKDLAEVFSRLLRERSGEAVHRGDTLVLFRGRGEPFGIAMPPVPNLPAYILSAPQVGAEVLMESSDPLLAQRRVGLGRSVTLAVPPEEPGAAAWLTRWQVLPMLAGSVRWTLRPEGDPRFACTAERADGGLEVTVMAGEAGAPMNLLDMTAVVQPVGDGPVIESPLKQVAPGRYSASLHRAAGSASVAVREGGRTACLLALPEGAAAEYAAVGPDWQALNKLAELGGGRILSGSQVQDLLADWREKAYVSLWPALLGAALGLMLIDWTACSGSSRGRRRSKATVLEPSRQAGQEF